jgi:hypothetical protein
MPIISTREGQGLFSRTTADDKDIAGLLSKFNCVENSLANDLGSRKKDFLISLSSLIDRNLRLGSIDSPTQFSADQLKLKTSELSVLKQLVDEAVINKSINSGGKKTRRRKINKKRRRHTRKH